MPVAIGAILLTFTGKSMIISKIYRNKNMKT